MNRARPAARRWWNVLGLAAAACALGAGGCGVGPESGPPEDFTLSVTVVNPPGTRVLPETARELRPARFVVEPDAVLRASVGSTSDVRVFPPPLRTLSRDQVLGLWTLTGKAMDLSAPGNEAAADAETIATTVREPTAYIFVAAQGRRRSAAVSLKDPDAGPTVRMIRQLSRLAWIRE